MSLFLYKDLILDLKKNKYNNPNVCSLFLQVLRTGYLRTGILQFDYVTHSKGPFGQILYWRIRMIFYLKQTWNQIR